jgi:hypothetical protein
VDLDVDHAHVVTILVVLLRTLTLLKALTVGAAYSCYISCRAGAVFQVWWTELQVVPWWARLNLFFSFGFWAPLNLALPTSFTLMTGAELKKIIDQSFKVD